MPVETILSSSLLGCTDGWRDSTPNCGF